MEEPRCPCPCCTYEVVRLALRVFCCKCDDNGVGDGLGICDGGAWRRRHWHIDNGRGADCRGSRRRQERRRSLYRCSFGHRVSFRRSSDRRRRLCRFHGSLGWRVRSDLYCAFHFLRPRRGGFVDHKAVLRVSARIGTGDQTAVVGI